MRSPLALAFILAIKLYRQVSWMDRRNRSCLFAVSCSRQVEQETRRHGFVEGVRSMRARFAACRPGYTFEYDNHAWWLVASEGTVVPPPELSLALVAEAKACHVPVNRF